MLRTILVPLDGSSFGEQALPLALSIARRSGASLKLMHVHQSLDAYYVELQPMGESVDDSLRKHEKAYLENVARRLGETSPVKVSTILREGQVADQVMQHAAEAAVDLVIMTTHARGDFARFWLGSTADQLVRELPMPLLLLPPSERPLDLQQETPVKNVLVPLDGTPLAEQILAPATTLASLFGAGITLLRVVRPLLPAFVPVGMGTFSDVALQLADSADNLQRQIVEEAKNYLNSVAERLRAEKLSVTCRIAVAEQPGVGVLTEAGSVPTDLIALETHGRRGLKRLLLGSVADKVLRGSPVPVLLHRPKQ